MLPVLVFTLVVASSSRSFPFFRVGNEEDAPEGWALRERREARAARLAREGKPQGIASARSRRGSGSGCPCGAGARRKGCQAALRLRAGLLRTGAVLTAGLGTASGSPRFYRAGPGSASSLSSFSSNARRGVNRTQCTLTGGRRCKLSWLRV